MRNITGWWRYRRPRPYSYLRAFWQRGRRGWSYRDAWSIYSYIDGILAEVLLLMAETRMGSPCRGQSPGCWELDDNGKPPSCSCHDLWTAELRENAERFRLLALEDWYLDYDHSADPAHWMDKEQQVRKEAMAWLSEWWEALWD